jgi:hypothetical protein
MKGWKYSRSLRGSGGDYDRRVGIGHQAGGGREPLIALAKGHLGCRAMAGPEHQV